MGAFDQKVAVITGGGGVLCSRFAMDLAMQGAKVVILDINEDSAKAAAEAIVQKGGTALAVKADCLDKASLIAAKETAEKTFGPCDILINGAGGNHPKATTQSEFFDPEDLVRGGSFFDMDDQPIRFIFDLNVVAAFLTSQVFARSMAERGCGTILNVSSMNAYRPLTKIPAYSAAKAAVSNLTQWMAVHLAPAGIRVNALAPGFFATAQNRTLLFDAEGNPTARTHKILSHTPMNRLGTPDDLTGALLFLLSDETAAFITGVILPVDGGFAAYSGV